MPAGRYFPQAIFNDERLHDCTPLARWLFVMLWLNADREGRYSANLNVLRGLLPAERASDRKIEAAVQELEQACFLVRYVGDGRLALELLGFRDGYPAGLYLDREAPSRFPAPPPEGVPRSIPDSRPDSIPDSGPDTESGLLFPPAPPSKLSSARSNALLQQHERQERVLFTKHVEGEREKSNVPAIRSQVRAIRKLKGTEMFAGLRQILDNFGERTVRKEDAESLFALVWFGYWMKYLGDPDDMLDDKREGLIRRRFVECDRDGSLMLYVVDGVRRDDFRMGRDHRKGDDPRLRSVRSILKDFETMKELAKKGGWRSGAVHPMMARMMAPEPAVTHHPPQEASGNVQEDQG